MLFAIEHLEENLSEWLLIEYSHAAKIAGRENMVITNVTDEEDFRKLSKIAKVERASVREVLSNKRLIVLDPQAKRCLSPVDGKADAVVVGGILGDYPPRHRTSKLLTKFLPGAKARNIGKFQLSIDGAVYVAKEILGGRRLEEIPMIFGLEIEASRKHSVYLPYAYPLVDGKPLISCELVNYLKRKG
ncbi:MAG: hypothetical protein APU95_03440 [Hadesarchaea archaeon YNP_N21]|nr:MAG: hypothetical protein APU95_03440 [Hadesarchaea archaeon YNP_N21]